MTTPRDPDRVTHRGPSCRVCGERPVEEFRLLGLRVDGTRVLARVDHWAGCRRLSETVWAVGPAPLAGPEHGHGPAEVVPLNGFRHSRPGTLVADGAAAATTDVVPVNGRSRTMVVDEVRRGVVPTVAERVPVPVPGDRRSPVAPAVRPGRLNPPTPAPTEAPAARNGDFSFNQTVESVRHAEPIGTGRPLAETLRRVSVAPILVDLRERNARKAHERALTGEPQGDR